MEVKSYAALAIGRASNLQEAFKENASLSKRQRLTRRGVCIAYGFFQNLRDNAERRNKLRPYVWGTYFGNPSIAIDLAAWEYFKSTEDR